MGGTNHSILGTPASVNNTDNAIFQREGDNPSGQYDLVNSQLNL